MQRWAPVLPVAARACSKRVGLLALFFMFWVLLSMQVQVGWDMNAAVCKGLR